MTDEQREGLKEQIASDTEQLRRMEEALNKTLDAMNKLRDHIAYCKAKLKE
jgi:septal ring factor EnvC (AmiA/AmiB activator)